MEIGEWMFSFGNVVNGKTFGVDYNVRVTNLTDPNSTLSIELRRDDLRNFEYFVIKGEKFKAFEVGIDVFENKFPDSILYPRIHACIYIDDFNQIAPCELYIGDDTDYIIVDSIFNSDASYEGYYNSESIIERVIEADYVKTLTVRNLPVKTGTTLTITVYGHNIINNSEIVGNKFSFTRTSQSTSTINFDFNYYDETRFGDTKSFFVVVSYTVSGKKLDYTYPLYVTTSRNSILDNYGAHTFFWYSILSNNYTFYVKQSSPEKDLTGVTVEICGITGTTDDTGVLKLNGISAPSEAIATFSKNGYRTKVATVIAKVYNVIYLESATKSGIKAMTGPEIEDYYKYKFSGGMMKYYPTSFKRQDYVFDKKNNRYILKDVDNYTYHEFRDFVFSNFNSETTPTLRQIDESFTNSGWTYTENDTPDIQFTNAGTPHWSSATTIHVTYNINAIEINNKICNKSTPFIVNLDNTNYKNTGSTYTFANTGTYYIEFEVITSLQNMGALFSGITSITEIEFPYQTPNALGNYENKFSTIPANFCHGCTSLKRVDMPSGLKEIGYRAFGNCSGLTNVCRMSSDDMSDDFGIEIGDYAFYYCTGLTNINLNTVKSFGEGAFSHCDSLNGITLSDNLNSLPKNGFFGNGKLKKIDLPKSIISIGEACFTACTGLTNIIIPNNCNTISKNAFSGCTSLTSLTIGENVQNINESAFSGCTKLNKIYYCPKNNVVFGANVFSGVRSAVTVYYVDTKKQNFHNLLPSSSTAVVEEFTNNILKQQQQIKNGNYKLHLEDDRDFIHKYGICPLYTMNALELVRATTYLEKHMFTDHDIVYNYYKISEKYKKEDLYIVNLNGKDTTHYPGETIHIRNHRYDLYIKLFNNLDGIAKLKMTKGNENHHVTYYIFSRYQDEKPSNNRGKFVYDTGISRWKSTGLWKYFNFVTFDGYAREADGVFSFSNESCRENIINYAFLPQYNNAMFPYVINEVPRKLFEETVSLGGVVLGHYINVIEDNAFKGCVDLYSIGFRELTSVGQRENIIKIGDHAFDGCSNLIFKQLFKYRGNHNDFMNVNAIHTIEGIGIPKDTTIFKNNLGTYSDDDEIPSADLMPYHFMANISTEYSGITTTDGDVYVGLPGYSTGSEGGITIQSIGKYAFKKCNVGSELGPFVGDGNDYIKVVPEGCYMGAKVAKTIVLSKKIIGIDKYAFAESTVEEIVLHSNILYINSYAFYNCPNLRKVYYSDTDTLHHLKWIGDCSFSTDSKNFDCNIFGDGNFNNYELKLLPRKCLSNKNSTVATKNLEIPKGVGYIAEHAFGDNSYIKQYTFPNTLYEIANLAFSNNHNLKKIISYPYPFKAPRIGSSTFYEVGRDGLLVHPSAQNSTNLYGTREANTLKGSYWLSTLGYYLGYYNWNSHEGNFSSSTFTVEFGNIQYHPYNEVIDRYIDPEVDKNICTILQMPSSYEDRKIPVHGQLYNNENLWIECYFWGHNGTITINGANNYVSEYFTVDITNKKGDSGKITSTTTSINTTDNTVYFKLNSFSVPPFLSGNTYLNSVKLNPLINGIDDSAFSGCTNLEEILYGYNVKNIGKRSFRGCSNLTDAHFTEVEDIGREAFRGCTNLEIQPYGDSVKSLGTSCFSGCTSLAKIKIPSKVEDIPSSCFNGCTSLQEVDFGHNLETIGGSAFYNCTALMEIILPSTITDIGANAFATKQRATRDKIVLSECNIDVTSFSDNEVIDLVYFNKPNSAPLSLYHAYNIYAIDKSENAIELVSKTSLDDLDVNYCNYFSVVYFTDENTTIKVVDDDYISCVPYYKYKYFDNNGDFLGNDILHEDGGYNNTSTVTYTVKKTSDDNQLTLQSGYTIVSYQYIGSEKDAYSNINVPFIPDNYANIVAIIVPNIYNNLYLFTKSNLGTLREIFLPDTVKLNIDNKLYRYIPSDTILCLNDFLNYDNIKKAESLLREKMTLNVNKCVFSLTAGANKKLFNKDNYHTIKVHRVFNANGEQTQHSTLTNSVVISAKTNSEYIAYFDTYSHTYDQINDFPYDERRFEQSVTGYTSIGEICSGITALKSMVLSNYNTCLMNNTFSGCTGLSSLTLNNIQYIDRTDDNKTTNIFGNCSALTELDLPNQITFTGSVPIGNMMFYNCNRLKSLDFRFLINGTSFGNVTFSGCTSLETLKINGNFSTLHQQLISGCTNLKTLKIQGNFNFSSSAVATVFKVNNVLEEIELSSPSLTNLHGVQFSGCTSLKNVKIISPIIGTNPPQLYFAFNCFRGCTSLERFVFPENTRVINENAFNNCTSLTEIVFNEGLTTISSNTFAYCSKVTDIYFANSDITKISGMTILEADTSFGGSGSTSTSRIGYSNANDEHKVNVHVPKGTKNTYSQKLNKYNNYFEYIEDD